MKSITASGQILGPFSVVTETADRYVADGVTYLKSVIGAATVGDYTPPPVTPPPAPVPASVTNFQARAVLMQMPGGAPGKSLFDDVNAAILAAGGVTRQAWEYANDITRDGATVAAMAAQFNLTPAQLDDLFRAAAKISA